MSLELIVYFLFVHLVLLIPGYVIVRSTKLLAGKQELELCLAYVTSITLLAAGATVGYLLEVDWVIIKYLAWVGIALSAVIFIRSRYYRNLLAFGLPIACAVALSLLSTLLLSLTFSANQIFIPDPEAQPERNYNVLNVKVLNVTHTNANDNYVPYRQAQFFINRSDPAKDSFIDEWGVHFFQRTPLMGAVTASYFNLLGDRPPVDYLWSIHAKDPGNTYAKFQIIAHVLNSILVIPGYFLLRRLFNRKVATVSCLFIVISPFFIYNSIFSWPKSLVAFLVITFWLFLMERGLKFIVLAGAIAGIAYLAHDLAVLYIGAGLVFLLIRRRFRDSVVFGGISALFSIPWLITSALIFKKPSTFALYPFSTEGLPQPDQGREVLSKFLQTSPLDIVSIRIDTLFYLLSPYDMIYSTGGQPIDRRLWATGIFSIPGSVGAGLFIPALAGVIQQFRKFRYWSLIVIPILLAVIIIGWRFPRSLGSLHFAQPLIVVLVGFAIAWLMELKRKKLWIAAAYLISVSQLIFFLLFSYEYKFNGWLTDPVDMIALTLAAFIVLTAGWSAVRVTQDKPLFGIR